MHVEYLIIGQGIAGTLLSYELMKAGKKVLVVDDPARIKASLSAGGLLNPFSAREWAPMRSQEQYLPTALDTYRQLEQLLQIPLLQEISLLVFPENEERRAVFHTAANMLPEQVQVLKQEEPWLNFFRAPFGLGMIQGPHRVDAGLLIGKWREYLVEKAAILETHFDPAQLRIGDKGVEYQDISAAFIVFCEGSAGQYNSLFPDLPFTRNRGEALLLSIPGLPGSHVYQQELRLIPRSDGLFWCGSNYSWDFSDLEPDIAWREAKTKQLEAWLKLPFSIAEHLVAERPTTAGQRVICTRHPEYGSVYLFNGLGTRGFSSGPWHARQLSISLLQN